MSYISPTLLSGRRGNNAFAWEERKMMRGSDPFLTIPALIDGTIEDVLEGDTVVFEEMEDGILRSCRGLRHFVRIDPEKGEDISYPNIIIFDNHNHALYFWLEALRERIISRGAELIHIDEHSDLWANEHHLDLARAETDPEYAWEFTNLDCNVGNYIEPALSSGLIGSMIRIENEHELDRYIDYTPSENSILNLDLDFFAPEMDFIDEAKKMKCIRNLMKKVKYVTIATSPYFIEQGRALQKLQKLCK